ncbi:MAG: hypothetical protein NWQ38_07245 [Cellulophaga sp.]|nr:hypothetical protein [Cellulophaga sp.]
MKKSILLLFLLLFFSAVSKAQITYLEVTNTTTQKVRVIKEHKRVVVFLKDGTKVTGKYHIENNQGITIKDQEIPFEAIAILKRQSITKKVIGVIFLSAGGITILSTLGIVVGGSDAEFVIAPALTGIIFGGVGYGITKLNSYPEKDFKYAVKYLNR